MKFGKRVGFSLLTIWALAATILVFWRNPLPFPDRGHRVFGVQDERARKVVVAGLKEIGGLSPRFTFDSGPIHQTLMWDNTTVIAYFDQAFLTQKGLASNAISLAVEDPNATAASFAQYLRVRGGYSSVVVRDPDTNLPPNHIALVTSNAFDDWILVFRRSILNMPTPNKRPSN